MTDTREPIRMTDKKETKLLPCSYPGCGHPLIVNKFESAARARCPDHKNVASSAYREEVDDSDNVVVNRSLGQLCCPFHPEKPMSLLKVERTAKGRPFQFVFRCRLTECMTTVEIMPEWAPMVIPRHPPQFEKLVKDYNKAVGGISESQPDRVLA